jgi:hypothetical protein
MVDFLDSIGWVCFRGVGVQVNRYPMLGLGLQSSLDFGVFEAASASLAGIGILDIRPTP